MRCGVCGGGVVTWNRVRIGCATARNKGTCSNMTDHRATISRLCPRGAAHRLMDPALMEVFCEEYTRHLNERTWSATPRARAPGELAKVNRDLDRLVQALLDGTPARTVKDRMAELEARKEVLERSSPQGEDVKVAMHPSMAGRLPRAGGQPARSAH